MIVNGPTMDGIRSNVVVNVNVVLNVETSTVVRIQNELSAEDALWIELDVVYQRRQVKIFILEEIV